MEILLQEIDFAKVLSFSKCSGRVIKYQILQLLRKM